MYRCTPALIAALLIGCSHDTSTPPGPSNSAVSPEAPSGEIASATESVDREETVPAATPRESAAIDPGIAAFLEGDEQLRARLDPVLANPSLPPFTLTDWHNSEPLDWSQLEGKLVLLDFWATWCGPCVASIPHTNELAERYAGEVVVIGVCAPNGADKLVETMEEHAIQYPVAVDDGSAWNDHFEVNGFPDYYLIGRNGELLAADIANGQVDAAIAYFLTR